MTTDQLLPTAAPPAARRRRWRGARTRPAPPAALDEIWDRHSDAVYSLAHVLLGNEADAATAVADAMTELAPTFAPADDTRRSWARQVYLRSEKLTGRAPGAADPGNPVWLGHLSPVQRASLALCLFGGHTYRDAAHLLDIPAAEVADLLTTALAAGPTARGGTSVHA